jgi:uncharacterized membrane protein
MSAMALARAITERTPAWVFDPRVLLLSWSAFMVAAILAAPWLAAMGRPEAWMLYGAFDPLCHQDAERSWHLDGMPLAVCVRCFGVYAGILIAAAAKLRLPVKSLVLTAGLMTGAWAVEFFGFADPPEAFRFVTGLALGAAMCGVVLHSTTE